MFTAKVSSFPAPGVPAGCPPSLLSMASRLWKTASTSSFSPCPFIFQPPVIWLPRASATLSRATRGAVPTPDSWTHRAHFRLYLQFLSVALSVINPLLKASPSEALHSPFSPWSPTSPGCSLSGWGLRLSLPPVPFMIFLFSSDSFHHFRATSSISLASISVLGWWFARITSGQVWRPSPSPAFWSSVLLGGVRGALGSAWRKRLFLCSCWFRPFPQALTSEVRLSTS